MRKSAIVSHTSSSIRTIPLVPEFHRVSGYEKLISGRGLYRQWGITPRPEDIGYFVVCPHYMPYASGMQPLYFGTVG